MYINKIYILSYDNDMKTITVIGNILSQLVIRMDDKHSKTYTKVLYGSNIAEATSELLSLEDGVYKIIIGVGESSMATMKLLSISATTNTIFAWIANSLDKNRYLSLEYFDYAVLLKQHELYINSPERVLTVHNYDSFKEDILDKLSLSIFEKLKTLKSMFVHSSIKHYEVMQRSYMRPRQDSENQGKIGKTMTKLKLCS
ncbi:MAG: hypothetical protein HOI53_08050 [Francisellaceae bacterium]|jgi:hypothetical protein|nr:hypothetical protein [Francisellaceae bacterium]MBT6207967.1 hypothetical protein [Francisellaceae bacterium]MBT6539894.1 hypothetical protein [Francisellaceae bacterium]